MSDKFDQPTPNHFWMFTCFIVYFHKGFNNFCDMDFYSLFLIPFGRNSLYIGHFLSYVMTMYRKIEKTKTIMLTEDI